MFFDTSSEHDLPLCTHDIIKGMTLPEIKPVTFRVNLGKIITERKREREREQGSQPSSYPLLTAYLRARIHCKWSVGGKCSSDEATPFV